MNASPNCRNQKTTLYALLLQRVVVVCAVLCASVGNAGETDDPWGLVDSFPPDIDLVVVVDNPAEQLLSDPGRGTRSFLGSIGMFSKTRRAWGAIGELFATDVDGVIDRLLSGRVVLLADSLMENSESPLKLMYTADTNWVVTTEIDEDSLAELRAKLKPVPREIVSGVAVYGIESGRYWLVMLNAKDGESARVMLSPKDGRALLERSLEALVQRGRDADAGVPRWAADRSWSIAARVRVDQWIRRLWDTGTISDHAEHIRMIVGRHDNGLEVSLALPFDGEIETGHAPVGLLSGLDEDIVLAMASSSITRLILDDEDGLSISLKQDQIDSAIVNGSTVLEPLGSLFIFHREDLERAKDENSMGMTVLASFGVGEVDAASMDAIIEPLVFEEGGLFQGIGQRDMGSYNGLFPEAVRSHSVLVEDGQVTNVSWLTTERSGSSELIFAFGDEQAETGPRVRMLSHVASSFDAVGGNGGGAVESPVVLSGFARLGALIESIGQMQWLGEQDDFKQLGLLTWEVIHEPGVLQGTVLIEKGLE